MNMEESLQVWEGGWLNMMRTPPRLPLGTRVLKAVTKTDAMHHGIEADLESGDIFTRRKKKKPQMCDLSSTVLQFAFKR